MYRGSTWMIRPSRDVQPNGASAESAKPARDAGVTATGDAIDVLDPPGDRAVDGDGSDEATVGKELRAPPFGVGGVDPVRLAPHAWHVSEPIGFTSPQRTHL
jgi:hypothetical protein